MLEKDRWKQVDALFAKALVVLPHERASFLAENCADEELRRHVERLLERVDEPADFLAPGGAVDEPMADELVRSLETGDTPADAMRPGGTVGAYRLLRRLGEGGMGQVWEAEQAAPRRRVALKLIKWGMDTEQVVARFESERQTLALMSHPFIARVFDGGATETGRPYFVMEYVRGIPITEHCDQHRLSLRERLKLFLQVCDGVQHAHHKGIIHRDLKPSNVLVAEEEGKAVPKIIDFGVARATDQHLTEKTVFTEHGQWIGTPEYMSPEQAALSGTDVDSRSDVYSLGVLLYELLTGFRPFAREPDSGGLDELRGEILHTEPRKPSKRVERPALVRQLRGELDWIALKALEKEKDRRYGSPGEMADDIRRQMNREPVQAGPPGAAYRVRKFVLRHRLGVAAATAVVVALIGGTIVSTWQAVRANRAERAAQEEAQRAKLETETTAEVVDFLLGLFEGSLPGDQSVDMTAREILERGAERIRGDLEQQSSIRARLMGTIGLVQVQLGMYEEAQSLLEEAVAAWEKASIEPDGAYVGLLTHLGEALEQQAKFEEAEGHYRRALELCRQLPGDNRSREATSLNNLGVLQGNRQRFEEAAVLLRQSLDLRRELGDLRNHNVANVLNNLGMIEQNLGNNEAAEASYREAIDILREVLGSEHAELATAMASFGGFLIGAERAAEAEEILREALAISLPVFGERHPDVAFVKHNLAVALHLGGKKDEAGPLYRESCAMWREFFGDDHPYVAASLSRQGNLALEEGQAAEAEGLYSEALRIRDAIYGDESASTIDSLIDVARSLIAQKKFAPAEALLVEKHDSAAPGKIRDELSGEIVSLYEVWGRPEKAAPYRGSADDSTRP